jgi:hypothetical protein
MKDIINPIRIPRKLKKKIIKKYSRQSYKLVMSGEYSIKYCNVSVFLNNKCVDVLNYNLIKTYYEII